GVSWVKLWTSLWGNSSTSSGGMPVSLRHAGCRSRGRLEVEPLHPPPLHSQGERRLVLRNPHDGEEATRRWRTIRRHLLLDSGDGLRDDGGGDREGTRVHREEGGDDSGRRRGEQEALKDDGVYDEEALGQLSRRSPAVQRRLRLADRVDRSPRAFEGSHHFGGGSFDEAILEARPGRRPLEGVGCGRGRAREVRGWSTGGRKPTCCAAGGAAWTPSSSSGDHSSTA